MRDFKFRSMLLIVICSLPFFLTGCLFLRPYTPSARLCDSNKTYTTISAGYESYSDYWDYSISEGIKEISMSATTMDFGLRLRIPTTDIEAGISMMGISYTLDIKYGIITDASKFPVLLAIDAVGYWTTWKHDAFGAGAGPIINIVLNDKLPIDLVLAGYYQYYDYSGFVEYSQSPRDTFPSRTSMYVYAGFEFPFIYDSRASLGCSYAYYFDSAYDYKPVFLSFSVKYSPLNWQKAQSEESKNAASPEANAVFYSDRAKKFMEKKQYGSAMPVLTEGLAVYPDDYLLNNLMGYCAYQTRDLKLSYIYYKKAIGLNPGDPALEQQLKKIETEILHGKK